MANTYTLSIASMIVEPVQGSLTDVVASVAWIVTATDGSHSARRVGTTKLGPADSANFTKFNELTESQVAAWLGDPVTPKLKADLDAQLARSAAPRAQVNRRPPWVKSN